MPTSKTQSQINGQRAIGLLGGVFDPIHIGHLHLAWQALTQLSLDEVWFIPAHIPLNKTPTCSAEHRVEMLALALQPYKAFSVNRVELERTDKSYTLDTLKILNSQSSPNDYFYFLMGQDNFNTLDTWHQWQKLIDYCHIIVCPRKSLISTTKFVKNCSQPLKTFQKQFLTGDISHLKKAKYPDHGSLYALSLPSVKISSESIRLMLQQGHEPKFLLPDAVIDYIKQQKIY